MRSFGFMKQYASNNVADDCSLYTMMPPSAYEADMQCTKWQAAHSTIKTMFKPFLWKSNKCNATTHNHHYHHQLPLLTAKIFPVATAEYACTHTIQQANATKSVLNFINNKFNVIYKYTHIEHTYMHQTPGIHAYEMNFNLGGWMHAVYEWKELYPRHVFVRYFYSYQTMGSETIHEYLGSFVDKGKSWFFNIAIRLHPSSLPFQVGNNFIQHLWFIWIDTNCHSLSIWHTMHSATVAATAILQSFSILLNQPEHGSRWRSKNPFSVHCIYFSHFVHVFYICHRQKW